MKKSRTKSYKPQVGGKWEQQDNYHWQRGDMTIAGFRVSGQFRYVLTRSGKFVGQYETSDQAKQAANGKYDQSGTAQDSTANP